MLHKTYTYISTSRPRRNRQHFADDIFKRILSMKMMEFSMKISLTFAPKGQINNIPPLFQKWPGAVQVTSHYLNQICWVYWCINATRLQRVKQISITTTAACTPKDIGIFFHYLYMVKPIRYIIDDLYSSHYFRNVNQGQPACIFHRFCLLNYRTACISSKFRIGYIPLW